MTRPLFFCAQVLAALGFFLFFTAPAIAQNLDPEDYYHVVGNSTVTTGLEGAIVGDNPVEDGNASAEGYTVTIDAGANVVKGRISGAYVHSNNGSATATNNHVILKSGTVMQGDVPDLNGVFKSQGAIVGGGAWSEEGASATATGNSVTIHSGSVVEKDISDDLVAILGGYAVDKAHSGTATASGNWVTIDGGDVTLEVTGYSAFAVGGIGGGMAEGGLAKATNNHVTISDGTVTINIHGASKGAIVGGYAQISESEGTSATVTGNSLTILGGTVAINGNGIRAVAGGYANAGLGVAASNHNATAEGNSVTISGGKVITPVIAGGYAWSNAGIAKAINNIVTIDVGGTVVEEGIADIAGGAIAGGSEAYATGNTVNIYGNLSGEDAHLLGGLNRTPAYYGLGAPTTIDLFSGNTLNLADIGETRTVASVQNFETINFEFPAEANFTVLTVTEQAVLGTNDENYTVGAARGTIITASTIGGAPPLKAGDKVTLIDGTINGDLASDKAEGRHGVTLHYNWALDKENGLVATLESVEADPGAKALSEGFLGGFTVAIEGGDLVAGQGIAKAVQGGAGGALGGFGAVSAGSMRYNSGSHVDVDGFSLMAGLSKGLEIDPGKLTVGAFLEFGIGSYETYNSFGVLNQHSEGKTRTLGAGVLSRFNMDNGFYSEGSFRAGVVRNEYQGGELHDLLGRTGDYTANTLYTGLHLGSGYALDLTEATSLDLYGKYFWTRQGSESVTLATGDPVEFKAVNSHRLRGGARLSHTLGEAVSPYVGAAYEYEMDGKAKASSYGVAIDAPSLRGGTGMAELGVNLKPVPDSAVSLDLGIQGFTGKREGVSGSLQVKFEF